MKTRNNFPGFLTCLTRATLTVMFLLLIQSGSYAVTRAEMLGALFSELKYPVLDKQPLPADVPQSHKLAKAIGSSLKYGLIPKTSFSPEQIIDRHDAIHLALMLMGWEFETSLNESFENLPDLGGSGDPVFFLAAEMKPSAPRALLVDGWMPLSDSGRDSILSWVRNCKKSVVWNRVFSYNGVDLVIYRQGVAQPGVTNEPKGINPVGAPGCEPLYVVALANHPEAVDTRIAFAEPLGSGRARISDISYSYDAIAAVNGGFFAESRPLGAMLLDGIHAGKPLPGRSAVGWTNGGNLPIFGQGSARIGILTPIGFVEFTKFNVSPPPNEASLYTSGVAQAAAGAALDAIEIVVQDGVVTERREASMSDHRTPRDGFLVVARGNSRSLLEGFLPGVSVNVTTEWDNPAFGACTNLIQAGPMLLRDGQFITSPETFKADILEKRHPRTIMGTDGKRMFWVVIDGRNSIHSRGTTIAETRWVARSLGLTTAINMDGGGSSQLIWRGIMANWPSDGKERPLPYALLVMNKGASMVPKNVFQFDGYEAADQSEYGDWSPAATDSGTFMMDTYDPLKNTEVPE
jgi:hypothetical protein